MEIRQLNYLLAVAEEGNFTRAAERCHIAQPSLSQQIHKLEDELGAPLFHRHPRKVELTEAGKLALGFAGSITREVAAFETAFAKREQLVEGEVTIGIIPTIAPYLMPDPVAKFQEQFPGIRLRIREATTPELLDLLVAGKIDFAIASDVETESKKRLSLHVKTLFHEELLLAHPMSHPLSREPKINISSIPKHELLVLSEGHCLADQVLKICHSSRGRENIECGQLETVLSLVAKGLGVTVVPKMAAGLANLYGLNLRSFSEKSASRIVSSVKRRGAPLSPAADTFSKFFLESLESVS